MDETRTNEAGEVDQNLEEAAGASARGSELRGPALPKVPLSNYDPTGGWPDGPKGAIETDMVVDQLRKVQRRVVQIVAQDEFGNDATVNFVLENESDDEDRFYVRKVE